MAARTRKVYQDSDTIERIRSAIQTGQLVKRLTDHINGAVELNKSQVSAALGLLKKTLPDLTSVEHSGEIETHYVARLPTLSKNMDEWDKTHATPLDSQTLQ